MHGFLRAGSALLLAMLAASAALAQTSELKLQKQKPISKDFDAFPRVTGGLAPEVAKRINDSFARADARGRKAIADCRTQDRKNGYWERNVDVTMSGPQYLSVVSHDNAFCGGAHPNGSSMALVFDLSDGKLVDLAKLLPDLVTSARLDEALDGSKVGVITSPKLVSLYKDEVKKDANRDQDCNDAVAQREEITFIAYPAPASGGLVIDPFGIERVVQACFDSITLTPATLEAMRAAPALIGALKAARR